MAFTFILPSILCVGLGPTAENPSITDNPEVVELAEAIESGDGVFAAVVTLSEVIQQGQIPDGSTPLLIELLRSTDPGVLIFTVEAIQVIAERQPDELVAHVPDLAAAVASPTLGTRARCDLLMALSFLGERAGDARTVLEPLIVHENNYVKVRAAVALAQIVPSEDAPVEQLVEWLSAPVAKLRWVAAWGLSTLGIRAESAVAGLRDSVLDPHPSVRAFACRALWRITGDVEDILPVLVASLEAEPEAAGVRPMSASSSYDDHVIIAVTTLAEFGSLARPSEDALLQLLRTDDQFHHLVAIRALAEIVEDPVHLLSNLGNDSREHVRRFAMLELERIQSTSDD